MPLDHDELTHLLIRVQDGVVSRRQLLDLGGTDSDLARMLRRRDLTRVQRGVFINHTGAPSQVQLEWAAVLACWPAALGFESALGLPTPDGRIRIVVPNGRALQPIRGVRIQAIRRFEARVDLRRAPPKVHFEEAVIDACMERDTASAFTLLTDVLHSRRTTTASLRRALTARPRVKSRNVLQDLLADLETGTCSVLERGYLRLVERPHGLPVMDRQRRDRVRGRTIYRDGSYASYGVVVELDGLAFHNGSRARSRDSARDLETLAATGEVTTRLTHHQVFADPCRTAELIGRLLVSRGWQGRVRRCPRCPWNPTMTRSPLTRRGRSES